LKHKNDPSGLTLGAGLGFVDVFSPRGRLLPRLEHGDWFSEEASGGQRHAERGQMLEFEDKNQSFCM
jgi:hypothetical protein